jgi:hypothetical protein
VIVGGKSAVFVVGERPWTWASERIKDENGKDVAVGRRIDVFMLPAMANLGETCTF